VERWSLLHDAHGARFGCMTTNLAESYNFVLRGNRALPLTAIVEGIFYGTLKYFKERCEEAQMHNLRNPNTPYCEKIAKYMEKKIEKGRGHMVVATENEELRFEVRLQTDKFGTGNIMRTHQVKIGTEKFPTCECTCNKPKLFQLPCSHVLAACGVLQIDPMSFVSPYYGSMVVVYTWTSEMHGYRAIGNFNTVDRAERKYIPDPSLKRTNRCRRQCRRIRNNMDESEAGGPTRQCFLCNAWGHKDDKYLTFYPNRATRGRTNRGRKRSRKRKNLDNL
jgi:hypothetical protein